MTSFQKGFLKAASDAGYSKEDASEFYKEAHATGLLEKVANGLAGIFKQLGGLAGKAKGAFSPEGLGSAQGAAKNLGAGGGLGALLGGTGAALENSGQIDAANTGLQGVQQSAGNSALQDTGLLELIKSNPELQAALGIGLPTAIGGGALLGNALSQNGDEEEDSVNV